MGEVAREIINELERSIKQSWLEIKKDYFLRHWIWWGEQEIISSFYYHLRLSLKKINEKLKKKYKFLIIPEYTPKMSSHARKVKMSYPLFRKNKRLKRAQPIDIGIIRIGKDDLDKRLGNLESIWEIKHMPLILMEFKNEFDFNDFEKDILKLNKIKTYLKLGKFIICYFCFIEYEKKFPSKKDYYKVKTKLGSNSRFFKILEGCYDNKKKWKIKNF